MQHLSLVTPKASRRSTANDNMLSLNEALVRRQPTTLPPEELIWECPICGVIEPLALPTGRWIKRSCECQRQARKAKEHEEMREAWQAEQRSITYGGWLGTRWTNDHIVKQLAGMTFAGYEEGRFPDAYRAAVAFAQNPKGTLAFYGSYGVGKTHLEASICNYLREQGQKSLFASAPLFFSAYNDAMKYEGEKDHHSLVQRAISTPLLILDDIDKARPTDARWDTYYLIINERYNARRPIVLSTNKLEELDKYIGEAAVSRLSRNMVAVEMTGADYRLED